MSPLHAEDLRRLEGDAVPAWLWDVDRARLVWANRSGLAFWNEATLLDLLDRRFDPALPALRRMAALVTELASGAESRETFAFPRADGEQVVTARCRVQPLDDGRAGMLVVMAAPEADEAQPRRGDLLTAALHALPMPVALFDRHGSLVLNNAACTDLATGDEGGGGNESVLAGWLGDPDRASALIEAALRTGSLSEVVSVHTRWGVRAHRVTARRIAADLHGRTALVFLFDDVEDRRRVERGRERDARALREHLFAGADAIFALDRGGRLSDLAVVGELDLAADPASLIGRDWLEAAAALGFQFDGVLRELFSAGRGVRGALATLGAGEVVISASPIIGESGQPVGTRGVILRLADGAASRRDTLAEAAEVPVEAEGQPTEGGEAQADAEEAAAPIETAEAPAPARPRPPRGDDAATLAAIGRAVAENAVPAAGETGGEEQPAPAPPQTGAPEPEPEAAEAETEPPAAETAAEPATAAPRFAGGLDYESPETVEERPQPLDEPRVIDLAVLSASAEPTLVHRAFDVFFANEPLARLLGRPLTGQALDESNLLNLFPEERARLFGLQSRVDDGEVLHPGDVGMIPLKAPRPEGGTHSLMARIERVRVGGSPAVLMRFEDPLLGATAEPKAAAPQAEAEPALQVDTARTEQARPEGGGAETGEAESSLRAAQERIAELSSILNSAADGIVTLDDAGTIVTANASAEAILGRPAREMAGTRLSSILSGGSAGDVDAYIQSVAEGNLAALQREGREVEGRRGDGAAVPIYLTIGRMNIENGSKFCAVLRDITDWKAAETNLRRDKERAEEASTQKSDFLARISHELRTPLNAIIGFSEVMSTEKFGPIANDRYKSYLEDIHASGEHLLSLINDLLDLSKIEAGKLELNFASVDLSALIGRCIALMQPQATHERVIIRSSLPDDLPAVVADERALRQILLNLLSNAIKYTPPGGQVILSVVLDDEGRLQVRIRDTGRGMTQAELKLAMEPFRRIESAARDGAVPGTGLGLPLTKALVEANRAEFRIESTPQAGTLVQITFPPERVLAG